MQTAQILPDERPSLGRVPDAPDASATLVCVGFRHTMTRAPRRTSRGGRRGDLRSLPPYHPASGIRATTCHEYERSRYSRATITVSVTVTATLSIVASIFAAVAADFAENPSNIG
jgi:hypothetical protein